MLFVRHIPFLKQVVRHSITAFGGPQMHFVRLHKLFVEQRRDVTEDELLEMNAFCQLLPGASSSQLLTLIGFKRGGIGLALITLLIWITPACALMGAFSFLMVQLRLSDMHHDLFRFLPFIAVGFLGFAGWKSYQISVKHLATGIMMLVTTVVMVLLKSPWLFPILMVVGGVVSNFSDRRIPDKGGVKKSINWSNIWLFATILLGAGFLSEYARIHEWVTRKPINLFENFYRLGSYVFGGGQVLIPMMLEQFVLRRRGPHYLSTEELMTGAALVQAVPGPVFSIAAYVGGMAMDDMGFGYQLLGCFIGGLAIFLPSLLLVLFFYPVWSRIKQHTVIYRALEGINAVAVGVLWAGLILLILHLSPNALGYGFSVMTVLCLFFTRIPSPLLVLAAILVGWLL